MSEAIEMKADRTRRVTVWSRMRHGLGQSKSGLVGLVIVSVVILLALLAPLIAPHSPIRGDLRQRLLPPAWQEGGSPENLLGTDQQGRDVLTRVIFGARISLLVGFGSVFISGLLGTLLGLLAGYYRGWLDDVISRVIDIQLAVPYLLLAVALMMVLGSSLRNIVLVLVIYGWTVYARLVRAETFSVREREFVTAARAAGASDSRIILRHVLPNVFNPVIVMATLEMANMIIFEAGLSFLGLGIQPPTPSWGVMLSDGRDYIPAGIWWPATFPGIAISITILGINQLGDWLRDVLDPRTQL